jgi:hypothetical protein
MVDGRCRFHLELITKYPNFWWGILCWEFWVAGERDQVGNGPAGKTEKKTGRINLINWLVSGVQGNEPNGEIATTKPRGEWSCRLVCFTNAVSNEFTKL